MLVPSLIGMTTGKNMRSQGSPVSASARHVGCGALLPRYWIKLWQRSKFYYIRSVLRHPRYGNTLNCTWLYLRHYISGTLMVRFQVRPPYAFIEDATHYYVCLNLIYSQLPQLLLQSKSPPCVWLKLQISSYTPKSSILLLLSVVLRVHSYPGAVCTQRVIIIPHKAGIPLNFVLVDFAISQQPPC